MFHYGAAPHLLTSAFRGDICVERKNWEGGGGGMFGLGRILRCLDYELFGCGVVWIENSIRQTQKLLI